MKRAMAPISRPRPAAKKKPASSECSIFKTAPIIINSAPKIKIM